ncbi:hypothetical protein NE236_34330 [Actinoallomurus purpureus]|uniref:hypothetical protein n=1 Tax=Actinoallomurus purpureus TaxID=478114 RepID=UPI002092863C|nr:hypothetical protein [Actinoallomurus purpureus]MCO6010058.1 hypothetical protein [Actinoallomurus purpureus]
MKKHLFVASAVAALALVGAGTATSAFAKQPTTTTRQAAPTVQASKCISVTAKEKIHLRKSPRSNSASLRFVYKNTKACWIGFTPKGGKYKACGGKSDDWDHVTYRGSKGWVPTNCIK